MKITLRQKVILAFSVFMLVGVLIWLLNYFKHDALNRQLLIIEQKDTLLNIILEARRYEKNYFLSLDKDELRDGLVYVQQAEKRLRNIIDTYGKYAFLSGDLDQTMPRLVAYENSLEVLLAFSQHNGLLKSGGNLSQEFSKHRIEARSLGRSVTSDVERMVKDERAYVKMLIRESKLYHIAALVGILFLSVLAVLFLVFSVNRPLKAIEDAIQKIAAGDYVDIPSTRTGDEFESLVSSLNNMISELNKRSEQLVEAKKMASLGTLTSGVAHELNNPLNNISTSVQILLEELEDTDMEYKRGLLMETERQIDRARDIVRALLEFSRERTFSLQEVGLKALVDNTIRLIKGELPADVELVTDVPDEIKGRMDSRRIQQVLLNLILNALQAMEDGGTLKITASKQEQEQMLCIQVQDTGEGIAEEDIPKVFDPFFTTRDVSSSPGSAAASQGMIGQAGTGLGLSICHGIVQQHGGRIEVQSRLGEGTTFSVYLPLAEQDGGTD